MVTDIRSHDRLFLCEMVFIADKQAGIPPLFRRLF